MKLFDGMHVSLTPVSQALPNEFTTKVKCTKSTEHSQSNIPRHQRLAEGKCSSILHPSLAKINQHEIDNSGIDGEGP